MSKTSTVSGSYSLSGDGFTGSPPLWALTLINNASNPPSSVALVNGFVQTPVPATATAALIAWNQASTLVKTLKGITGDTGVPVGPTGWVVLTFVAGSLANIGITCTGAEQATIFWG